MLWIKQQDGGASRSKGDAGLSRAGKWGRRGSCCWLEIVGME